MTEAEILFPVQCPICANQALTGFRISVVSNALRTGEIRLYAICHAVGWEASDKEIFLLHEYLEAGWSEEMQETCRQIDLENSAENQQPVFVHTEMMEQLRMNDATGYLSAAPLQCSPEAESVRRSR
jgi:endogenous inhibitor of DNA gyrase (YacG/DUF329 family)